MAYFTQINHNTGQPHFVRPLQNLTSTALDSDTLYDLPNEDLPTVVTLKGRKRGLTQSNRGRTASLGDVWEYVDDADLQYGAQVADIEDHIPKKRKVAPLKQLSLKKATTKTLSEFWEEEKNTGQTQTHHQEQRDSQWTTPPDPRKIREKRAVSSTSQSKTKKTKPFKNPTITKPSVGREKESENGVPSAKPVSIHQGWTTTEDAVKLNLNDIAKTTLDKLSVFRYKSSADPVSPVASTKLPSESEVRLELDEGRELQLEPEETGLLVAGIGPLLSRNSPLERPHSEASEFQLDDGLEKTQLQDPKLARFTSDHDTLYSDGQERFFTDVLWNIRLSSQHTPSNSPNDAKRNLSEPRFQQHIRQIESIHCEKSSIQYPQGPMEVYPQALASPAGPNNVADCFGHNSSEPEVFGCLPDYTDINQPDHQVPETSKAGTPAIQIDTTAHSEQGTEAEQPNEYKVLASSYPTGLDFGELLPQTVSFDHHHSKICLPKSLIDVQVERSDVNDTEAVPRDIPRGYEPDGFDEGIDDNNFLALVSEPVIPDTQFSAKSRGRENHTVQSQTQTRDPTLASAWSLFASSNPVDLPSERSNPDPAIENPRTPTPSVLSSEADDEYPMNEMDEERFKMPRLVDMGVTEQFRAPESLQFAFGDEPGSGEVYGSSLQFSPLKHLYNGFPPMKVPSDLPTDKLSAGASPAYLSEAELLPLGEEEDRNFVCFRHIVKNAEVHVDLGARSDPHQRTITQFLETGESLLPSKLQSATVESDSAIAPTSAIRTDSASILCILDDSHEYQPLLPFARPHFPILVRDCSPVIGVSAQTFLRVCFRIGEMFKEGARCEALKQDAVIELFARVTYSSREPGTTKQHFQFADLWHDRPPFPNGILANYKTTVLADSESKALLDAGEGTMARCLGRLKRDGKSGSGWMLLVINIRTTDWEEIRWTKRVVNAGLVKSETMRLLKA